MLSNHVKKTSLIKMVINFIKRYLDISYLFQIAGLAAWGVFFYLVRFQNMNGDDTIGNT